MGSDHHPVLSTSDAAPQIVCLVVGPSLQERHWGPGEFPEKGNKAGEWSREQVLWENWGCLAWRKGGSGETLSLSTTTWKEVVARWVSVCSFKWQVTGWVEMASSCTRGGLDWVLGKISSLQGGQALEQAAQGGGWVTIPAAKTCRCGA